VEDAVLSSDKSTAAMSADNYQREPLQLELDYIYQRSGLIYLGETVFDDGFKLLRRGNMDPRALISMLPDVLQRPNILKNVMMFQGVKEQLIQLGNFPRISKLTNFVYKLMDINISVLINDSIVAKIASNSDGEPNEEYGKILLKNAKDIFLQYLQQYKRDYSTQRNRREVISEVLIHMNQLILLTKYY
jgi:hypothetical protein